MDVICTKFMFLVHVKYVYLCLTGSDIWIPVCCILRHCSIWSDKPRSALDGWLVTHTCWSSCPGGLSGSGDSKIWGSVLRYLLFRSSGYSNHTLTDYYLHWALFLGFFHLMVFVLWPGTVNTADFCVVVLKFLAPFIHQQFVYMAYSGKHCWYILFR